MRNKLDEYLESEHCVGLDKVLFLQRRIDGTVAVRFGITSLAPLDFIVGLLAGYALFA